MLIAGIVAFCLLLLVAAFVFPRLSRGPEDGAKGVLGLGGRGASKAPGRLGHWLAKPFRSSSKAVGKSGSKGREGRSKLPF
ncbi:unannotated protein [freshwater metagenome]|uniref:Unannotated protein n=1 Tax=freshwater metagenome TaxID=449393 RepID=A0A6J7GI06_9ZZZZ|nr:hypothetical protein [Actinomycetota bacterium]